MLVPGVAVGIGAEVEDSGVVAASPRAVGRAIDGPRDHQAINLGVGRAPTSARGGRTRPWDPRLSVTVQRPGGSGRTLNP
jgi:hypothetical protein